MTGIRRPALSDAGITLILAPLTLAAFVLAEPGAWREMRESGEIYLFTWRFLADIPARLAGPGRFRFILQPAMAVLLGIRDGTAAARAARAHPPSPATTVGGARIPATAGLSAVANLALMAILLDLVFQWMILGVAHPGAALVVGPTLITCPYVLARTLARRRSSASGP